MVVWRRPPKPANEALRQAALCEYDILDTEPEACYDRITALCRKLFRCPVALLTFIDKDRVWMKSAQGLGGLCEIDRGSGLCAWTLLSRRPEALVVPDMLADRRFANYPVVTGPPHARFYAGVPLVCPRTGHRLGTLCVVDTKPRPEFTAEQTSLLAQLAAAAMREVERRRRANEARCAAALQQQVVVDAAAGALKIGTPPPLGDAKAANADASTSSSSSSSFTALVDRQGVMLLDAAEPAGRWPVLLANAAWCRATGVSAELAVGARFWDLFEPPEPAQRQAVELAVEQGRAFELRVLCNGGRPAGGGEGHQWTRLQMRPAASPGTDAALAPGGPRAYGPAQAVSVPASLAPTGFGAPIWGEEEEGEAGSRPAANGGDAAAATTTPSSARYYWALVEPTDSELEAIVPETSPALLAEVEEQQEAEAAAAAEAAEQQEQQRHRPPLNGGGSSGSPSHIKAKASPLMLHADGAATHNNHSGSNSNSASWAVGAASAGASGGATSSSVDRSSFDLAPAAAGHGSAAGVSGGKASSTTTTTAAAKRAGRRSPAGPGPASTTFALLPQDTPLHDITLGALLGWGSYGRVHRGWWNGMPVAIKVVQQPVGAAASGGGGASYDGAQQPAAGVTARAALEPLLHHRLSHPGIVQLYEVVTQRCGGDDDADDDSEDGDGGARHHHGRLGSSGSGRFAPAAGADAGIEVWMVLEHCDRGTLADAVARGELADMRPGAGCGFGSSGAGGALSSSSAAASCYRPDPLRVATTAREVAEAMAYLHRQRVLHGDLNGNNILLCGTRGGDARGFVSKVADFGLSRLAREGDDENGAAVVAPASAAAAPDGKSAPSPVRTATHGTATHMAPEVLSDGTLSRAADVWSFGVVLYELLAGERPFAGCSYAKVVLSVTGLLDEAEEEAEGETAVAAAGADGAAAAPAAASAAPPRWSAALQKVLPTPAGAPPALARVMERCLAPRPEDRPTFEALVGELKAAEQAFAAEADAAS